MTPWLLFILASAGLTVLALVLLLRPLMRVPDLVMSPDRDETIRAVYRDQLRELEHERAEGLLSAEDFERAALELRRRLLDEMDAVAPAVTHTAGRADRLLRIVLLVGLPLAAAAGYAVLGTPEALDPVAVAGGEQSLERVVGALAERLKAHPDDAEGWVVLARAYKAQERFDEAVEAYRRGRRALEGKAALLADFAEVQVRANGGHFSGEPDELIARALSLEPDEPQALFLAGSSASDRGDFDAVVDFWGRLLVQLKPGSEEADTLARAVEKAREIARERASPPSPARRP